MCQTIRTIKLQIEAPSAGEAAMAGERGWPGKGAGFQHRASVALPPNVGESLGLPAASLSIQVQPGTEG